MNVNKTYYAMNNRAKIYTWGTGTLLTEAILNQNVPFWYSSATY